jgi:hypothetical protein
LKWVVQTGAVIAVGTGADATKVAEYTKEDLDIFGFELTPAEMTVLNKIGSDASIELEFNCTHSFEAECDADPLPPWNKNLTCAECVRKIDGDIHKRDPEADCDKEAKEFVKKDCKAGGRSLNCKRIFQMECNSTLRPERTKNLTCDECVRTIDEEIKTRDPEAPSCDEEARVFAKKECTKGASVCHASEYCCPEAKKCLTPTQKTCLTDASNCTGGEICCPMTKLCVKPGATCKSPCPTQGISDK